MTSTLAQEKGLVETEQLEVIQRNSAQLKPTHYRPQDEAEKRLNKRVNFKLDCIVVLLLAAMFIVCTVAAGIYR